MNICEELLPLPCVYKRLAAEKRPVLLYGMGNGAEKIYSVLSDKGIKISGVFASEGFVRGQSFLGYRVMSLEEAEAVFGDFAAVLCFALEGDKTRILAYIKQRHTLYSPNLPVYGEGMLDREYILSQSKKIQRLYDCLADNLSKELFVSLLKYNITGETDYLTENKSGYFYPKGFFMHNKRHIDVGAYNGDTVIEYTALNPFYSDVVAFEPDIINYKKLKNNTAHLRDVICEKAAVCDREGNAGFYAKGSRSSALQTESEGIRTVTIDGYCSQRTVNATGAEVGSIKIDAEGADREVLQGAVNVIYRNRPDIMAALYHRASDLIDLPLLIRSYDYKYKLYLRKKEYVPAWDVFLLAASPKL